MYLGVTFFDLAVFLPMLDQQVKQHLKIAQVAFTVPYCIIVAVTVTSTLYCTLVDPTDRMVVLQRRQKLVSQSLFDFQQYQLELFCDHCNAYVQTSSKHCKRCDRCAEHFDHHCKWINNCVGGTNYKSFVVMCVAVCTQFALSIAVHGQLIQHTFTEEQCRRSTIIFPQDAMTKFILSVVLMAPCVLATLGLLQLIAFHCYLIMKGLTTYAYILNDRSECSTAKVVPYPPVECVNQIQQEQPIGPLSEPEQARSEMQQKKCHNSSQGQITNFDLDKTPQRERHSDPPSAEIENDHFPENEIKLDRFRTFTEKQQDESEKSRLNISFEQKTGHLQVPDPQPHFQSVFLDLKDDF